MIFSLAREIRKKSKKIRRSSQIDPAYHRLIIYNQDLLIFKASLRNYFDNSILSWIFIVNFDVPPTIALMNEMLLPVVLFLVYISILMYLFYDFPESDLSRSIPQSATTCCDYNPPIAKKVVITKSDRLRQDYRTRSQHIETESTFIDEFLGRELARDPQKLKLRLFNLKFIDSLEHFSIYEVYRTSRLLGIDLKSDGVQYKPIEKLKAEIKAIFDRSPKQAIAAITNLDRHH